MYTIYEVKNGAHRPWAECDILTYGMQICNAVSQINHSHMIVVNECDSLVMYDIGSHYDPDEKGGDPVIKKEICGIIYRTYYEIYQEARLKSKTYFDYGEQQAACVAISCVLEEAEIMTTDEIKEIESSVDRKLNLDNGDNPQ